MSPGGDGVRADEQAGCRVFAVCAIASIMIVAVQWQRLAGSGIRLVLIRVGIQIVASALVVLTVAGLLNQQNGWYGNWSDLGRDLSGASPAVQRTAVKGPARATSHYDARHALAADQRVQREFGPQRAAFERSARLRPDPPATGQYLHVVVPGLGATAGPRAGKVLIWLPASYLNGPQDQTFPVLQAYAGVPGGPADYDGRMGLHKMIVAATLRSGLVSPIVVIPDYTPAGLDTECTNTPRVAMETWLTTTVPNWVISHLRVRPDKASWAVMGYSAGGFCAEVTAFLHPQRYGAAMLFGSYNQPVWSNLRPTRVSAVALTRYHLIARLQHQPPPVDVWIEVSTGDRLTGPDNAQLIRAVRAPTSVTAVYLRGAGHRFNVWASAMPGSLDWLARTLPGFGDRTDTTVVRNAPQSKNDLPAFSKRAYSS